MAIVTGLKEYQGRLRALPGRVQAVVLATLQSFEEEITEWMQANRKWTDRTKKARENLHSWTMATAQTVTLYIAHGVSYGVYLELYHQGDFAILRPAIRQFRFPILARVRANLEKAFGGKWVLIA